MIQMYMYTELKAICSKDIKPTGKIIVNGNHEFLVHQEVIIIMVIQTRLLTRGAHNRSYTVVQRQQRLSHNMNHV